MKDGANVPKLRFPEFLDSEEWEVKPLGKKTIKVGSGITPNGGEKNYKSKGRPFIRSQNIGWGCLLLDDVAFIDDVTHSTFSATEINNGDVFLNITGASIGRSAVADCRVQGGNVNQHVCIIRTKKFELNPYYLNQYLLSQYGQKQIDSFQSGGNRQGLNFAQIRSFSLPLPLIEEQQKIADCLSSIDDRITAETQKLATLKAHKKGLMQQLFPAEGETLPKLRFPEFRDAGEWEEKSLGDIASIKAGTTPPRSNPEFYVDGNIPWVKTTDLNNSYIYITEEKVTSLAKVKLNPEGSILVAMYGGFNQIGRTGYLKIAAATNQAISVLKVKKDKLTSLYLLIWLNSKIDVWRKFAISSRKDANITGADVRNFPIAFPSLQEQQKIADCLSSLDQLITAQTQKIATLKTHKKGLMQQLFPSVEEVKG
jgi:type I restriction enzyme S subunit